MERVTIRMPQARLDEIERAVRRGEYPSKSEAIRHAVADEFPVTERLPTTAGTAHATPPEWLETDGGEDT